MNRRSFLQNAMVGAVGGWCMNKGGLGGPVYAAESLKKIGLQLYTVRKEMEKDVEATLAKVAAIGFKEVEFAGYFNRTPEQIKATLKNNGLSAPSAHTTLAVKTIASEVGLPDLHFFNKTIRAAAGVSPRDYRERKGRA